MSGSGGPTPLEERAPIYGWARRALYGGGGRAGAFWRGAAAPLGAVWDRLAERRLEGAALGATRLAAPVVSVGNVTVGGGGKTSLVRWILEAGLPEGTTAAVLSRGYGREGEAVVVLEPGAEAVAPEAGDEPALLARAGAWVGVGADRELAARAVLRSVHPSLFLLDDGLQHRRIARSLDLVAFAGADLAAPARCLPAGPLRQGPGWRPAEAAWVVTGVDPREGAWPAGSIGAAFRGWWEEVPGTPAEWVAEPPVELAGWRAGSAEPFEAEGRPVVAFAGVARPESVPGAAREAGVPVSVTLAWPDHHRYHRADVRSLLSDHPEAAFLTTEKDAIKLDPEWFGGRPVGVLRRRLRPLDGQILRERIAAAMGREP